MDAKELRIGNEVLAFGTNGSPNDWKPVQITAEHILTCSTHPLLFKPIKLTETMLIMMGFTIRKNLFFYDMVAKKGDFTIHESNGKFYWGGLWVENVHELQNLHFAIKKSELIIK